MRTSYGILELALDSGGCRLTVRQPDGRAEQRWLSLPAGLALGDLREALVAMELVALDGAGLQLAAPVSCEQVRDWLAEVLEYFSSPNQPAPRLRAAMNAVHAELPAAAEAGLSLFAYAWLDLQLREDLAGDARQHASIWSSDTVQLSAGRHRARRLAEFARRLATSADQPSADEPIANERAAGELAPSARRRGERRRGAAG